MTSFFRTYARTYETQSSSYSGEGMDAIQGRFDGYYTWGDRHYTREDGHYERGTDTIQWGGGGTDPIQWGGTDTKQ